MGGSQSAPTRKISIPNEESQFIKISESVAERLKKCTEKSPEEMLKKPKEECEPTEMQTNVRDKHLNPDCKYNIEHDLAKHCDDNTCHYLLFLQFQVML